MQFFAMTIVIAGILLYTRKSGGGLGEGALWGLGDGEYGESGYTRVMPAMGIMGNYTHNPPLLILPTLPNLRKPTPPSTKKPDLKIRSGNIERKIYYLYITLQLPV